jgi:rsbT co-antagonist protein RsbR
MQNMTREEVFDQVAEVLLLLSEVTSGDFGGRLATNLPDTDPFGALYRGVNEAVEARASAEAQRQAYQRELEENLNTIERQRAAIRELSTPVIEIWKGVLCLPIVGVLDTARSVEMTRTVLEAVMEERARCVIIDITGIGVMDTRTADQFIRMAKAVQLLDAQCYLTGISPVIAQTIDQMGVDLSSIATRRSLRDALREYVVNHGQRKWKEVWLMDGGGEPHSPDQPNG